jgi:hypothetical protein
VTEHGDALARLREALDLLGALRRKHLGPGVLDVERARDGVAGLA